MPRIFTELDNLAADLRSRFAEPAIIGVDGWTGVGKTTLAEALANELGGSSYDLDRARERNTKHFTAALRLGEISEALNQPKGFLFVSGICLRQVLADIECSAAAHIYIKRMAVWGWADEDELTEGNIPEIPGASGEVVRQELRLYHDRWQPHVCADYEFQRTG